MRIRALLACSILAALCLLVCGCYEVSQEVIPTDAGEVLPYAYSSANLSQGGSLTLSKSGSDNDYRFQSVSKTGEKRSGSFRAMRVKGDVFAVQLRYDDEQDYDIFFEQITSNHFQGMDPAEDSDVAGLAKRHSVSMDEDPMDDQTWDLGGTPSDILGFIKAHSEFDFEPSKDD
jgi:hypothetical protein